MSVTITRQYTVEWTKSTSVSQETTSHRVMGDTEQDKVLLSVYRNQSCFVIQDN